MDDKPANENGLSYLDDDPLLIEIAQIDAEVATSKNSNKSGVVDEQQSK